MGKIVMKTPLVEMDGDEMTRIMWGMIKDILIHPFVELKSEYYDLSLKNREATADRVTYESADATKRLGVAVKCATITANAQRVEEYELSNVWPSPNATIRAVLDGTVFRRPIVVEGVAPYIPTWKKPITIARHAYGDVYKCVETRVSEGSKAELVITSPDGSETRQTVFQFKGDGIALGMHNTDESISSFARSCFNYALDLKEDLWFGSKDTISRVYDHRFKDIFAEIYEEEFKTRFAELGIEYFYTLIDDAVSRVIRSEGGFIWACKNYDGDVMSDMLATVFGSLSMMTSVLISPNGAYEYEAAHGTVTQHYYRYLKGETPVANPIATIFAWTGALRKRGELDAIPELVAFADSMEAASLAVVAEGRMTKDLYLISSTPGKEIVDTESYLRAIAAKL